MLKNFLDNKKCFKLICGAGNEDAKEVNRLVRIYSKAGCKFFDLCAKPEIIDAAKDGLEGRKAFFCVSIGIKGDPHLNKVSFDLTKCTKCGICIKNCPRNAVFNNLNRCIGCGRCAESCPEQAVTMVSEPKNPDELLPPLIKKGINCIELHCIGVDKSEIYAKWENLHNLFDGFLSVCIDRSVFSDKELINIIKHLLEKRKPYTTIIQADGAPMSGGENNFNTTLQAVAAAQIFNRAKFPAYLIISGGTNSKSAELAKLCSVNINGVAIGSYARKIIADSSSETDAVKKAKALIENTLHFL